MPPRRAAGGTTTTRPRPAAASPAGGTTNNAATRAVASPAGGTTTTRPRQGGVPAGGTTTTTRPRPAAAFPAGGLWQRRYARPRRSRRQQQGGATKTAAYVPARSQHATTRRPDGSQTHVNPQTHATINTIERGIASFEKPGVRATGFRPDGRAGHIEQSRPDGGRMVVDRVCTVNGKSSRCVRAACAW